MTEPKKIFKHAVFWVPTLYLAMGIPYNVINGTAVRMYKSLGYTDGVITVAVGSIGVAWSLKPLWAAFLDMYRTKKFFVLTMEWLCGLLFAAISMAVTGPGFFGVSIALLWVAAFASSTQDICADGVYLNSLDKPSQARFAGLQGAFWVLGKVLATGLLISVLDGMKVSQGWSEQSLWKYVMLTCGVTMGALALYHQFFLPSGGCGQKPEGGITQVAREFGHSATSFFHKREFWGMIAFVFLYRFGEGLILMEGQLFLQSATDKGGLGLTAGQASQIDAVYGTIACIVGGLVGGWFAGKMSLKRSLLFLGLALNVPHFTFVFLSHYAAAGHGLPYSTIATLVAIEKFGYGFGMVGNMIYMMQQLAPGRCSMTHYAFATSLMNLMLVPTAMVSGPLAEHVNFSMFFVIVMFASVPSVISAWRAPFPRGHSDHIDECGVTITDDDPSRLDALQQTLQRIAGRASIYAMLNILVILVVDSKILGSLQGKAEGTGQVQFGLLVASGALKLFLSLLAFKHARLAAAESPNDPKNVYVRNARGAKIATIACLAATAAILVFGFKQAY
jgi:MFS transporter, PAT family, beta-lactamase induction signal transducer AmpG